MTTGRRRGGGPRSRATGPRTGPTATTRAGGPPGPVPPVPPGTGTGGGTGVGTGAAASTPRGHAAAPGRGLHAVPEADRPAGPPTTPIERPTVTDIPVGLVGEDEVLAAARARAAERGLGAPGPATAAVWSFLAAATGARAAVELGTGVGVGTVALLRGMPDEGLLTSIDVDADQQRLARTACTEAGYAPGRLRLITGRAGEVLPRLSDAGYDLVVIGADRIAVADHPALLTAALRLLRPRGVVAVEGVLGAARATDPVRRDAAASAQRETVRLIRSDERLTPLLLPLGDGVLCAARR